MPSDARPDGKLGASDAVLGRAAFDAALAASAAGDRDAAIAWLDRACRLSPGDRTYTLALATQCLTDDAARAARLFALVTETDDVREAWLGLASARLRLGDARAAAALGVALSRHAMLPGIGALAGAVAAAAGAPGWCGLTAGGRLQLGGAAGPPALVLDGRPWAARDPVTPPAAAQQLAVRIGGRDVLGSPIALAAIRRMEGLVACRDGGLDGWAWHPGDPSREPVITLVAASGQRRTIRATPEAQAVAGARAMARVRRFHVSARTLARLRGPFALTGPDGTPLLGSPLDPAALPAPVAAGRVGPTPPVGLVRRRRGVAVVMPVHGGRAATLACLDSVFAYTGPGVRIVVVDDASPDPALAAALDRLAARRRIVLIRHPVNRGFPASANAGFAACAGRDVVLLNSDVLVPAGWLDRLRAAAYSAPDIGSVTPLSNDASLVSFPGPAGTNPVPTAADAARLDRLAQRANGAATADLPVGVGFCLYLRRDCLDATGLDATGMLRADLFAQGYGEEVDFCLRARHLGWRHVAATGVFVAHLGGQSFGAARRFLMDRNQAVLDRLYPGFDALMAAWEAAGGLAGPRRRLEEARWRAARPPRSQAVLLITHDDGGGVERRIAASCAAIARAGDRPVVLRPARAPDGGGPAARLDDGARAAWRNLIYALPAELPTLRARLRADRPRRVELHHLLGHHPAVLDLLAELGLPYDVHVHDYAWFCGRVALVGPQRRYCGEPAPEGCEACLAQAGRVIAEDISVRALIDRSARLLAGADRVLAPSRDAAARLRRHFPGIRPRVAPHENPRAVLRAPPPPAAPAGACRVVTVGAIGIEKGFDILLDCARDAAARRLPLQFVVVGHTIDDATLIDTGRVFVTGEFAPADLPGLIRAQRPSLGLLPSVWPETWCFALSDLWRAGLHVAAFDIGAQAERIRASGGRGLLLPLGLPADSINNTLLAAARAPAHQSFV
jgi:GT2 family glycosyltransferase/glycosyltransferase involved in cell wall biosynthesis